jgi:hypothetical protein
LKIKSVHARMTPRPAHSYDAWMEVTLGIEVNDK